MIETHHMVALAFIAAFVVMTIAASEIREEVKRNILPEKDESAKLLVAAAFFGVAAVLVWFFA